LIPQAANEYAKAKYNWLPPREYGNATINEIVGISTVDAVILVGMVDHAKQLVTGRDPTKGPIVILTDGAVTKEFLDQGRAAECVWGVFPARSEESSDSRAPSYAGFGQDAITLLSQLLNEAEPLNRRTLAEVFRKVAVERRTVWGLPGGNYQFGKRGAVERIYPQESEYFGDGYHLFQVRSDGRGGVRWVHRTRRWSLRTCGEAEAPTSGVAIVPTSRQPKTPPRSQARK
jgi:hypothetical protein